MTEHNHNIHIAGCSRRDAIRQLLCVGAVASVGRGALAAQAPSMMARVDLHHHFFAVTPLLKTFIAVNPYPAPILGYTVARSLEAMDQAGVSTAMLSCPLTFGDNPAGVRDEARTFARETNEFGARLVADHQSRFGLFAMLPLPDIDASLREIEYAFDTLHVDGVGLMTSYGPRWLGDDGFDEIFQELKSPSRHRLLAPH
jgi:predicted TIM-barrel fold metal-dependent hydrolase